MKNNKNALITGAAKGIGKAIALELAKQGNNIAINYNSSKKEAEELKQIIEKDYKVKAFIIQGNVSIKKDCYNIVETTISEFGSIDILVNNAGIIDDNLMIRMSDEAWERVLRTNLDSIFYCTKPALKSMLKSKWGRILNIGSVVGIRGNIGQVNYSSSKAGMMGFTKSLAKEVATRNITVNTITPGYINTEKFNIKTSKLLITSPEKTARLIYQSIKNKKEIIYVSFLWKIISFALNLIPEKIFKKFNF